MTTPATSSGAPTILMSTIVDISRLPLYGGVFGGQAAEAVSPFDASVVLLERLDGLQMSDILKWSGTAPVMTFIDPPPPTTKYALGTCREAEISKFFSWRDHVSAYVLEEQGRKIYLFVQRGQDESISSLSRRILSAVFFMRILSRSSYLCLNLQLLSVLAGLDQQCCHASGGDPHQGCWGPAIAPPAPAVPVR